ncbi:FliA/WhiG family RNA polymerase sigma factor [Dissulfurirhabdus thermomarina]|uniref:FliA/WhiG family RNA polymerase sigma factor n=1 Tax=Dissulfurirhabdus thermomarina TaxID=1765737 RepID=A0A6N9TN76_DISTH|nr:FliA/WhiG family RNA polymerase sigma factor [Dissulfurirhabdus thermomarina]NDY42705.1 FliA/WhiG family RNA polymerase sigma factor [Dissulfurirhabdus thermomarina]NMX24458.1 FliA/WhiG family RNA polymerase sigma factor [Dissulfurirhabdus thermomarina]
MEKKATTRLKDYTATFFGDGKELTPAQREELILKYTPLIKYIAGRLAMRLPPHISVDDLISSGIIGLIDAIKKFDPGKKIQFKTYAEFRIRGAMLDELRSMDWIPRSVRKKATELERAYQKLEKELGRPAEDEEVARELGITIQEFHDLLEKTRHITFLDIEVIRRRMPDSNEEDLFDLIEDKNDLDPFTRLNMLEVREVLMEAIKGLPEKERLVVSLYYYEDLTMREIGEIMGYTESRISQMHTKAMLRLRARLRPVTRELNGILL